MESANAQKQCLVHGHGLLLNFERLRQRDCKFTGKWLDRQFPHPLRRFRYFNPSHHLYADLCG